MPIPTRAKALSVRPAARVSTSNMPVTAPAASMASTPPRLVDSSTLIPAITSITMSRPT